MHFAIEQSVSLCLVPHRSAPSGGSAGVRYVCVSGCFPSLALICRSAQFCCGELIKRHVCTWLLLSPCKKVLLFFVLPYGFWWSLLRISATRLMHEMEGCPPYFCTKVLNFSQIIPFVCKCNLFACVFPMGTEEQGIEFVFQKQEFFSINAH